MAITGDHISQRTQTRLLTALKGNTCPIVFCSRHYPLVRHRQRLEKTVVAARCELADNVHDAHEGVHDGDHSLNSSSAEAGAALGGEEAVRICGPGDDADIVEVSELVS